MRCERCQCRKQCSDQAPGYEGMFPCAQCPMQRLAARQDDWLHKTPTLIKTVRRNYQEVPAKYRRYHQQRDFLALWHGHTPFSRQRHAQHRGWERYVAPIQEPLTNGPGFVGPCWIWLGGLRDDGYAPKGDRNAAFKAAVGRKPKRGASLNHLCHRRACAYPGHLYEGDDAANARDRLESPFMDRYTPSGFTWGELGNRYDRVFETARHGVPAPTPLIPGEVRPPVYLLHDHDWHTGFSLGAGGCATAVCSICNMTSSKLAALPVLNAILSKGQGFEELVTEHFADCFGWRPLFP